MGTAHLEDFIRVTDTPATNSVIPPPHRAHFLTLDAARGIAAIAVVLHHIGVENGSNILRRGFFAVDFFLILSGFVIALSYESKIGKGLSLGNFLKLRIARLWPMVILGGGLAVLAYAVNIPVEYDLLKLSLQFALIPVVTGGLLFPFNPPLWSLLYEVVANIVHGACLGRLTTRQISAIFIALLAVDFAILAIHRFWAAGFTIEQAPYAIVRIFTGYIMGILIYRLYRDGRLPIIKAHFLLPLFLILIPLLIPKMVSERIVAVVALGCIFPIAMLLGINNPSPARWNGVMKWLGGISFPLYITHMPIMYIWRATGILNTNSGYGPIVWALPVISAIIAATIFERWYDLPIRMRLRQVIRNRNMIGA